MTAILDLTNLNSNPIFFGNPVYFFYTDFLYLKITERLKSGVNICTRQCGANLALANLAATYRKPDFQPLNFVRSMQKKN